MEPSAALGPNEVLLREDLFELPTAPGGEPRLLGSRCPSCGCHVFPRLDLCPNCDSDEPTERVVLGSSGTVFTYTVARQALPGFDVPYVIAAVRLEEGVDVLAHIETDDVDEVRIGLPVKLSVGPIKTNSLGQTVLCHKYRPAGGVGTKTNEGR